MESGSSLRCRDKAGKLKVTFKSGTVEKDGALEREELEKDVSENEFREFMKEASPPSFVISALAKFSSGKPIKSILDIKNQRETKKIVREDSATVAELALDRAVCSGFGREEKFCGTEVELKGEGNVVDLETLSTSFKTQFPGIKYDSESKYSKGVRLLSSF